MYCSILASLFLCLGLTDIYFTSCLSWSARIDIFPPIGWSWLSHFIIWINVDYQVDMNPDTFVAVTNQLYEQFFPSFHLSVRLSVHPSGRLSIHPFVTTFSLCSCHHIIVKFSGVINIDKRDVQEKGWYQRSKTADAMAPDIAIYLQQHL